MNIKLTKPQIKTLRLALYLAAEWEDSLIDANRMDYPPGKWCDAKAVNKCKSNIAKFNALRSSLYQFIKGAQK
jgi:hypothetical protein